jgi:hypothetical protein
MEKKSFVFYCSWNEAIKKMDEKQIRLFISNLCNYAEGQPVTFDGLVDEIMWSQVKPLLDHNENKRQKRIEGGKKGGLAKASNDKQAVAGYSLPSVEGRGMMEEGKKDEGKKDEGKKDEGKKVEGKKVEGRGMMVEGKKDEGKKVDVDMDEVLRLKNKIDKSGWGSLAVNECSFWYDYKHLIK